MKPTTVALIRSLILVAILAAIIGAITLLSSAPYASVWWALPLIAVLRTIEGYIDGLRGQAPQQPLGSKPADPTAYIEGPADPGQ